MAKSFDKKHYREVKKYMDHLVSHHPWCYEGSFSDYFTGFIKPMITFCEEKEDFEGAKATKDALIDFLNKHLPDGEKISYESLIK